MLYGLLQAASTASNKGADDDDDQEDEEDVAQDEIEETVKPFTTYLLQLEKVIRDFILYASSEREVAGRRWHFKRFFASDCRISKDLST